MLARLALPPSTWVFPGGGDQRCARTRPERTAAPLQTARGRQLRSSGDRTRCRRRSGARRPCGGSAVREHAGAARTDTAEAGLGCCCRCRPRQRPMAGLARRARRSVRRPSRARASRGRPCCERPAQRPLRAPQRGASPGPFVSLDPPARLTKGTGAEIMRARRIRRAWSHGCSLGVASLHTLVSGAWVSGGRGCTKATGRMKT